MVEEIKELKSNKLQDIDLAKDLDHLIKTIYKYRRDVLSFFIGAIITFFILR